MKSIWDEDVWSDDELSEEEVIIPEETSIENEDVEEDDGWFRELMQEDEDSPVISSMKADPLLASWVPAKPVGKVSDNAKYAYDYLNSKGLPQHVSAGIVGNLMKESGVNPNVKDGDRRGGIGGIAQWDPSRSAQLRAFSKNPNDLYEQLDFLLHESQQRGDLQKTLQAKTPEEAALIFGRTYERPNEKYADWGSRQQYARNIMSKQYGGINNIPYDQLEGVSDETIQQYLNEENAPEDYEVEQGGNAMSFANKVTNVTDTIHSGLDRFQRFKDRFSKIGAEAARSTSDAIDITTELAGIQRDASTRRKFNANKNRKNYSINNQSLNQPLIYT